MAIKVTAIFQMKTNLPADVVTNTFHFNGTGGGAAITAATAVDRFYNADLPEEVHLANQFSQYLNLDWTLRVVPFDPATGAETGLANLIPRTLQNVGTSSLPTEVAICLSYRANATTAEEARRRRGRIYLGPWASGINSNEQDGRPYVSNTYMGIITDAAARLASESSAGVGDGGSTAPWCVYSRADGQMHTITGGWVDEEFDTQRRRGVKTTDRVLWTTV